MTKFEGFPFIVGWELTLACNLRCSHCGSSAANPRPRELTPSEALAICDQLPELLVQEVDFTGGEPLLRRDWWQIAARLGELGIGTKILSNGLLLNADTIAQMLDVGIAGVGVSIDGLESTHDHIRGREGLFRQVVAGVERVLDAGLPATVITTVNALNLAELPDLFTMLQALGISAWQVQPIFPLGRGATTSELQLARDDYLQLGDFVKAWQPKARDGTMALLPGDSFGYYTDYDDRQPAWRGCSAGLSACGITSEGMVKGCLSMPDALVEGDLREHTLWDIWFHSDAFAYNRRCSPDDLGPNCHDCDMGEECRGGCSAMSYGATGQFHNDPYCFQGIAQGSSSLSDRVYAVEGV